MTEEQQLDIKKSSRMLGCLIPLAGLVIGSSLGGSTVFLGFNWPIVAGIGAVAGTLLGFAIAPLIKKPSQSGCLTPLAGLLMGSLLGGIAGLFGFYWPVTVSIGAVTGTLVGIAIALAVSGSSWTWGVTGASIGFFVGAALCCGGAFLYDATIPLAAKGPHQGYMGPLPAVMMCSPIGAVLGAFIGAAIGWRIPRTRPRNSFGREKTRDAAENEKDAELCDR